MSSFPSALLGAPIAHRGLHDVGDGRAENSTSAIKAGIARGYCLEIDVQLTADDQAVVFHDYGLGRLTGETGPVRDRSAAELAQIHLTGGSDPVPRLPEVLDLVAGQVPLLVEIKAHDRTEGGKPGPLEASVARALASYDGPVAVMSYNPDSIAEMQHLLPGVARGLVTGGTWAVSPERMAELAEIPDFDRIGASFISHDIKELDSPRVAELKASGAHVLCWTVRSAEDEANARQIAENITFEGYLPPVPS